MRKVKRVKIIRNGELVDSTSPQIRTDQGEKLKRLGTTSFRRTKATEPVKLCAGKPVEIYTANKIITCSGCRKVNPTKRMNRYARTSRGQVILCESCDENAEIRTFCNLDALDFPRKKIKV